VQTKIYDLILKASPLFETGVDVLTVVVRNIEVLVATVNNIAAKITPDPTDNDPASKALANSLKALEDAYKELGRIGYDQNKPLMDPIFAGILQADVIAKPKRGQP